MSYEYVIQSFLVNVAFKLQILSIISVLKINFVMSQNIKIGNSELHESIFKQKSFVWRCPLQQATDGGLNEFLFRIIRHFDLGIYHNKLS